MVIDWLEKQHHSADTVVLYLYCSYKEEEVQTLRNMIGSLLKQAVRHRAALPDAIRKLYNKHIQKSTQPTLEELTRLLEKEIKAYTRIYLVIDALDECPERSDVRARVLATIEGLPQNAQILITSRYSAKIEERFENVPQIDILAADEDVKRYVEARIGAERLLAKLVRSDRTLMEDIMKTVVENSQGMYVCVAFVSRFFMAHADFGFYVRFLLAQLHMDSLAKKLNRREVRAALGGLPKELDETYDQAMLRIQHQDEGQSALAHRVLYWISYSLRPLTVDELRHALAVEPGDDDLDEDGLYETELMVSVCAGLVTVDEESNQIRLVHYTTQSYFERIRTARFPEAPSTIADICLTYLMFSPFAERYCPSKEELTTRLNKYPFLSYAADYRGEHIRIGMNDGVRELVLKYLSNNVSILSAEQAMDKKRSARGWFDYGTGAPNLTRLHVVASLGLVDIAPDLLADGADVNVRTDWRFTPLHLAAEAGHTRMVHFLLRAGAEVGPKTVSGITPLHSAVRAGHEPVVQILIDAGADLDETWRPLLHSALGYGHIDVAKVLIVNGTNIDQKNICSPLGGRVGATPLIRAVEQGRGTFVSFLLDNGADISATDEDGGTSLHRAASAGHAKLMNVLITRGIDVSTKDHFGRTALHYAARKEQTDVVQILLENDASVLAEDWTGKTAFHEAAAHECESVLKILLERIGKEYEAERWLAPVRLRRAIDEANGDEVRFLLEKGADPNALVDGDVPLLHLAIERENYDVLQLLLSNGARVNIVEHYGGTPLHWAACRGYHAGVRLLLNHGANIQAGDVNAVTPLHLATGYANASMVKLLIENGARLDVEDERKRTALYWVINPIRMFSYNRLMMPGKRDDPFAKPWEDEQKEYEEQEQKEQEREEKEARDRLGVLDLLIEKGADLTCGKTALLDAISTGNGRAALISRLLEEGIDVVAQTNCGRSMLYEAVFYRQTELVRLLIEHGADVNQKNKTETGQTALHEAAWTGSLEIASRLIEAGADVNAMNKYGQTAIHDAVSRGWESRAIVDLLLAYGVDINAPYGCRRETVLHHTANEGNIAMVEYLLGKGARIAATDIDGMTALDSAKSKGHEAMIFFLSRYNT